MSASQHQTVWFPKDFPLFVLVNIPLWGIGGLFWGLMMALTVGPAGSLIGWLFMGLVWGGTVWFCFVIVMAILCREVSVTIPLHEVARVPDRLDKAAKKARYTVEPQSPTSFICRPKHFIARLFQFQRLHVWIGDDSVRLLGPSVVINKVRKQLLAKSSAK